jgi:hypothetical protein
VRKNGIKISKYYFYIRIWICIIDSKVNLITRIKFKFKIQMKTENKKGEGPLQLSAHSFCSLRGHLGSMPPPPAQPIRPCPRACPVPLFVGPARQPLQRTSHSSFSLKHGPASQELPLTNYLMHKQNSEHRGISSPICWKSTGVLGSPTKTERVRRVVGIFRIRRLPGLHVPSATLARPQNEALVELIATVTTIKTNRSCEPASTRPTSPNPGKNKV